MSEDKSPLSCFSLPNPFVLRVQEDFGPPSPVAVVKDVAQPAKGCLKKLRSERSWHGGKIPQKGPSSEDVLRGKLLENETLSPTLRKDVALNLGQNRLLERRTRLTL